MSDEERRKGKPREGGDGSRDWGFFYLDFGGTTSADAAMLIILVILVLVGVAVLVYFIAIVLVNFLSLGEVHRASIYRRKVRRYSIDEPEGSELARRLMRMNIYFTLILFFFTAEEAIRYVLHTGPATIEIWIFRIICLGIFLAVLGVFLVRLRRWIRFKSSKEYLRSTRQIKEHEEERAKMYDKT